MSDNKENIKQYGWGYEITWADQPSYSGKILVFPQKNSITPMIAHKTTDKTYFINTGKFKLRWIDTKDGQVYEQELGEGGVWHIPPLRPSSLESLMENSSISEVNNSSNEEDILYLIKPDSISGV